MDMNQTPGQPKDVHTSASHEEHKPEMHTSQSGNAPKPPMPAATPANEHKVWAIVGYIIPILFFIPLVTEAKNDPFAKYHANQQLNLLLFWVVGQVAASVLAIILIGLIIGPLVVLGGIIFMIMGVMNAVNNKMKPLPLIGRWQLIK